MASGCLMGECPVCEELIWEDNYDFIEHGEELVFVHPECKDKAVGMAARIKKLETEVAGLKKLVLELLNKPTQT